MPRCRRCGENKREAFKSQRDKLCIECAGTVGGALQDLRQFHEEFAKPLLKEWRETAQTMLGRRPKKQ